MLMMFFPDTLLDQGLQDKAEIKVMDGTRG